jgi:hypothetical protein
MKKTAICTAVLLLSATSALPARAEPLLAQGIGTSNCARLAADIKPSEGLGNPVNMMLYSWVQGYVSAANVALLEYNSTHLDMSVLTDAKVLGMIADYCKAHPDKKPANALDDYIRTTKKQKTQWTTGTVLWDE